MTQEEEIKKKKQDMTHEGKTQNNARNHEPKPES